MRSRRRAQAMRSALAALGPRLDQCHAAVAMSHHLASDAAYLRELALTDLPAYIGLLGPEARRTRLTQELGPVADALKFRIRGPVGIDIGAVTPKGMALAIVGQIHARRGRVAESYASRSSLA
jgi:xanthine dehydrogenase accessory factor